MSDEKEKSVLEIKAGVKHSAMWASSVIAVLAMVGVFWGRDGYIYVGVGILILCLILIFIIAQSKWA